MQLEEAYDHIMATLLPEQLLPIVFDHLSQVLQTFERNDDDSKIAAVVAYWEDLEKADHEIA